MVEPEAELSITRQCELVSMSRGVFSYRPVGLTEKDLQLMEKLDELFTENPTRGTRRLSQALKKRFGLVAGRDKVRRLLRTMGIAAIYPKKNLSVAHSSHKKYPYLLLGGDHLPPESGVEYGYHLRALGQGVCVPDGHYRLV
jgi:putative transposase